MKKNGVLLFALLIFLVVVCAVQAAPDPEDRKGGKDHPMFGRMPGYRIDRYETKKFDSYLFKEQRRTLAVEGRFYKISYCIKKGGQVPSDVQIIRNYANVAGQQGGTVTHSDEKDTFLKFVKGGTETWGHIHPWGQGDCYTLTVVERQAAIPGAAADAAQMSQDIRAAGRVALYGIYFDPDRSVVKPESETALKEVARFLRDNPSIKVYVVGHTDSSGDYSYNQKLSEARAQAVVMELVGKYHIPETRLKSFGLGPLSPLTANSTVENRAKNRRVELVEQ